MIAETMFCLMIFIALIAKLIIFIRCHKIKYYCDKDNCIFRCYCDKYNDDVGFILKQLEQHKKENSQK